MAWEPRPKNKYDPLLVREARIERLRRRARRHFPTFFRAFPPRANYIYGNHTASVLAICEGVLQDLERGIPRYVIINMPFRHGKSDIVSRRLPAHALIRIPAIEVMLGTYNFELASDMSWDARRCWREAAPALGIDITGPDTREKISSWRTPDGGVMHCAGLGGTVTGLGAGLLILDDFHKNREEADSENARNKGWDSFQSDFMTRLAPVAGVIIVANRWHPDDLVGRILKRMKEDDKFPRFEVYVFPAQNERGEWLFPERFSPAWYEASRSSIGAYAWAAQAQQQPALRHGALFKMDRVRIVERMPEGLAWRRGWDLASTEKQRMSDNPDFTVGTKAAYQDNTLYVDDVIRGRWTATKRDDRIVGAAGMDGPEAHVRVEAVAGYKDTYERVRSLLAGRAVVEPVYPSRDKVARAGWLEPAFEAGRVVIRKAPWNTEWLDEFRAFPDGHDDQVDSVTVAVYDDITKPAGFMSA